ERPYLFNRLCWEERSIHELRGAPCVEAPSGCMEQGDEVVSLTATKVGLQADDAGTVGLATTNTAHDLIEQGLQTGRREGRREEVLGVGIRVRRRTCDDLLERRGEA